MLKTKYAPIYIMIALFVLSFTSTLIIGGAVKKADAPSKSVSSVSSVSSSVSKASHVSSSPSNASVSSSELSSDTESDSSSSQSSSQSADDSNQSEKLSILLSYGDKGFSDLSGSQLITVESSGGFAAITCWSKNDKGIWEEGKSYNGYVGYWGVYDTVTQNDSYTPTGLYNIGTGFGFDENASTTLDYFEVKSGTVWVTDESSKYYNKHMDSTADKDWNDAIDMSSSSAYKYGAQIMHGSVAGIFLCCGDDCTQHDVVLSEENMKEVLSWLSKTNSPQILIV